MKAMTELSKNELINLIYNTFLNVDPDERSCECAACGNTDKARYYYICDECEGDLKDD